MSSALPDATFARIKRSRAAGRFIAAISRHPHASLVVFLSLIAAWALFGTILANRGYPRRDSGIFLYVAQSILEGHIPYRDVWGDNKPPGIFYIDALGLFLGRGSIIGLWLVEFASLCVSIVLAVKTLTRALGLTAAFFGSIAWLIGLMLLFTTQNINLTEEYALPFQFAAFWLFLTCEEKGYRGRRGLALGALGSIAFLIRQNLVGVYVAIGVYLIVTRARHRTKRLLVDCMWIFAGAVSVIGLVFAYFAANSALGDLIDVAFRYNLTYTSAPIQQRLTAIMAGFDWLSRSGLGVIAIAAWVAGLAYVATNQHLRDDSRRLVALAVIAFPIELALAGTSIRSYGHYYEAWLPVIAVLAGFFARGALSQEWRQSAWKADSRAIIWQAAFVVGIVVMPAYGMLLKTLPVDRGVPIIASAATYVKESTRPGDYVLVWGADPGINYLSERRSPSKFVHQYPLLTPAYVTPEMVRRFMSDLESRPPTLIIDTSPVNADIPPLDEGKRAQEGWTRWGQNGVYGLTPGMNDVMAYLSQNYQKRTELKQPSGSVLVYERRRDGAR